MKMPKNPPASSIPPAEKPRRSALVLSDELRVRPPVFLNERELAHVLGICPRSIRNHVRLGNIPRVKLGSRVLFRWPQVEAALAKLEGRQS